MTEREAIIDNTIKELVKIRMDIIFEEASAQHHLTGRDYNRLSKLFYQEQLLKKKLYDL